MQETTGSKKTIAAVCAILLGIVFLVSGGWKVISPFHAGELLEEARVPAGLGVLGAISLGTVELFAAFLLFVPAFRKWGGLLSAALMIFFIAWIGYYYPELAGKECSCFPIIKRAVNPLFFVEDGVLLLMALAASVWSPSVRRLRVPAVAFIALVVFAGTSFGINATGRVKEVPSPIIADGKPDDVARGKVLIFFYDPSCMHCDAAARFMSQLKWNDARIVALPTVNPQWAASFLHDTHLKAETSLELDKLKKAFPFGDPPYGIAVENGHVKGRFGPMQFTPPQPEQQLRALGFIR
jgi:hypothetical protein